MLTADTKRKIDYLRDALVGRIPVPSQQIEQITLGLIYKFMSDIDEQNEELGGKSFFSGEYKKYSWKNIMDRSLAGHERVLFYAEGLEKMSRNKELPQLFRDIFKGAFLPFKDPAVLSLFLKGINEFKYENSEELGNAFEYLLSTAASQGDAGQFRTPRHIIDFIVEAVDPQKEDKILDPACGTAGFLVSAYKHILKNNTDKKSDRPGSLLTATERKKLTKNIVGYDISHEMVRLSLVNLYLHGFAEPNIYEYDTLSSLERWDDSFDCLLANPPFMTPRGGIKPHNRFPIQAKRSEVLFVDYITEHLTPNGKAGIIVPEGIIFQSGNAYKQLRKMLVEDGLWAVVSLPQGVFSPYSLVKTSILFFNNTIARQTKEILFVKVKNDGYDLGSQRRPIDKNDLPTRLDLLNKYKKAVQKNKKFSLSKDEEMFASVVKKEKIAKSGEYNLSADRYLVATDYSNVKWSMTNLGEVCEFIGGYAFKSNELKNEKTDENDKLVIKIGNVNKNGELDIIDAQYSAYNNSLGKFLIHIGDILVAMTGATVGKVAVSQFDDLLLNQRVGLIKADKNKILKQFLKFILLSETFYKFCQIQAGGGAQGNISPNQIKSYKIPLPPLEIQKEIVAELESYQKIFNGAKQVVDNYKPTIKIDPKWKIRKLGEISDRITKGTTPTTIKFDFQDNGINFVKIEAIDGDGYFIDKKFAHINKKCNEVLKRSQLKEGDVLFSIAGALGRVAVVNKGILPANTNQALAIITPKANLDPEYLAQVLRSPFIFNKLRGLKVGVAQYNISLAQVSDFEIPLPSIEIQKKIVVEIKEEQKMIETNKELIELFEQKIKDKISELWGE